jgi:hypothetical protein
MVNFVVARGRLRALSSLTAASALISLLVSYLAMLRMGVTGALCGVLTGETCNLAGIIFLALRERDSTTPAAGAQTAKP